MKSGIAFDSSWDLHPMNISELMKIIVKNNDLAFIRHLPLLLVGTLKYSTEKESIVADQDK